MEWLSQIATTGLPWYAAFALLLTGMLLGKGVQALLKIMGARFDERKYDDAQAKEARQELTAELKDRVEKLEKDLSTLKEESRAEREASLKQLLAEKEAHAACQIERAELKGEISAIKLRLGVVERHEVVNKQAAEVFIKAANDKAEEAKKTAEKVEAKLESQLDPGS